MRLPCLLLTLGLALTACSTDEPAAAPSPVVPSASPTGLPAGPAVTLAAEQQGELTWRFTGQVPVAAGGPVPVLWVVQFADGKVARSPEGTCPATTGPIEAEHTYDEPVFEPALLSVRWASACGRPATLQSETSVEVATAS